MGPRSMLEQDTARPPESIAGYALGDCIGEGGTGRVYRALSREGRDVAVKLLAPKYWGHGIAAGRLRREIRVLSTLRHRNVLAILDHGEDATIGPYLVTPFLEGRTLRALAAERPLLPESAALIFEPLLEGLVTLHAAGLVHRDIKPENVMFTPDGSVVIMDFGLAVNDEHTRCTEEGAVTGSVPYMSPEQIEGRDLGPASDVWSAAVMFYELVTGRRPFGRNRPAEEVAAILSGRFEPLRDVEPRASERIHAWLEAALRRDRGERTRDAEAMLEGLRAELEVLAPGERARDDLRTELAGDRLAHETRAARERADALVVEARAELNAKRAFAAIKSLDRALAYVPDHADAHALLDAATRAAPVETSASRPPRTARVVLALGLATSVVIGLFAWKLASQPRHAERTQPPISVRRLATPVSASVPAPTALTVSALPTVATIAPHEPRAPATTAPPEPEPGAPSPRRIAHRDRILPRAHASEPTEPPAAPTTQHAAAQPAPAQPDRGLLDRME